jgi:hypothetical protein
LGSFVRFSPFTDNMIKLVIYQLKVSKMKTTLSILASTVLVLLISTLSMIQTESKKIVTNERSYICPKPLQEALRGMRPSGLIYEGRSVYTVRNFAAGGESENMSLIDYKQFDMAQIISNHDGGHDNCNYDPKTKRFICKVKEA